MAKKYLLDNRYREFISIIVNEKPCQIQIHKYQPTDAVIDPDGKVNFSLGLADLGIDRKTFKKYKQFIRSKFCINFIGEFLVRENLDQFAELLTEVDLSEHANAINNKSHLTFGAELKSNSLTFEFHASLLQQILTEDFKMQVQDFVQ